MITTSLSCMVLNTRLSGTTSVDDEMISMIVMVVMVYTDVFLFCRQQLLHLFTKRALSRYIAIQTTTIHKYATTIIFVIHRY